MAKKKKDLWAITGLEKRAQQLLEDGLLAQGKDQKFCDVLNDEFAEPLAEAGLKLTRASLTRRLPKLIWTATRSRELRAFIRQNLMDPKELHREYFAYVPEALFFRKVKFFRGVSDGAAEGGFKAGMGRIFTEDLPKGAENAELPECSFAAPYAVPAGAEWTASFINGANIGIRYNPLIKENPVRRALSDAQKRGDACVVLTNLLFIDTTKAAGGSKTYRDQASGLHVKLEHLPEFYRNEAKRILRDKPPDEGVYVSIAARLLGALDGLHKITHRPDGSPEYTGRVVILLGHNEEKLINEAGYAEYRYVTISKQRKIKRQLAAAERRLQKAEDSGNTEAIERWRKRKLELEQQDSFTIISNFANELSDWHRRRMRAQVIRKLEAAIPNAKVISHGSGHISIGGHTVHVSIPGHIEVTDGLLASYGDESGAKVLRGEMARTAVVCHPFALNHRMVGRDDYTDGARSSAEVHVAPICLDDAYLRRQLRDVIKAVHPVMKVLHNEQFEPGVLVLKRDNGIVSGDSFPVPKLDNGAEPKGKLPKGTGYYPYPDVRYLWVAEMTDLHFGSRSRDHLWDKQNKRHLGVSEAAVELMRRAGLLADGAMPVHLLTINDDPTQGNHFDTHKQPDPEEMSVAQIEEWWRRRHNEVAALARNGESAAVIEAIADAMRFNLGQFLVRGLDWVQPQMEAVFDCLIRPNLDYFSAVLARAQDSKLVIRGLSEIRHKPHDGRDVGVINIGSGNHFAASVEDTLTEGVFYMRYLKALLGGTPRWKGQDAYVDKHVRAPLYSNEYFALGTVRAPGGYEWGLSFLGSPARLSSWSDPLSGVVNNDRARGDSFGHAIGRVTLKTYGDKHFKVKANTPYAKYVMCPANTHTDLYGERGFPPNNTGVLFIGLPAGGPDDGPVLVRSLTYDFLRDRFADPKPFDWEKFLPNPV